MSGPDWSDLQAGCGPRPSCLASPHHVRNVEPVFERLQQIPDVGPGGSENVDERSERAVLNQECSGSELTDRSCFSLFCVFTWFPLNVSCYPSWACLPLSFSCFTAAVCLLSWIMRERFSGLYAALRRAPCWTSAPRRTRFHLGGNSYSKSGVPKMWPGGHRRPFEQVCVAPECYKLVLNLIIV